MQFPCLLYKTPGPHRRPGIGTYRYIGCRDEAEFEALAAQGWAASLTALEADAPETDRAALERKADALGLKYDGRTSDKRLAERIAEASGGPDNE